MQQCKTLEELAAHFDQKVNMLRLCLKMQGVNEDKVALPIVKSMEQLIEALDKDLRHMRTEIDAQKASLLKFQVIFIDCHCSECSLLQCMSI